MTNIALGKVILLPIKPEDCIGKKFLFRMGGLYEVVTAKERRIVVRLKGGTETIEKDKFIGFYRPVAFFPDLPDEDRFVAFADDQYEWASQYLPTDGFGTYFTSELPHQAHLKYVQSPFYIKVENGYAVQV